MGWGGGCLLAASSHYHEVPTEPTAAGSLIWAIYTPVRSVQVPTNQAVRNYPPDTVSVHMWPEQHSVVHTHPCTQENTHCINILLASTHSVIQTLYDTVSPIWAHSTCICIQTIHTVPVPMIAHILSRE